MKLSTCGNFFERICLQLNVDFAFETDKRDQNNSTNRFAPRVEINLKCSFFPCWLWQFRTSMTGRLETLGNWVK